MAAVEWTDAFNGIAELLQYVAPCELGKKTVNNLAAFPRYSFVPTTVSFGQASRTQGEPHTLSDAPQLFEVHLHGADYNQAWRLLSALVTATRQVQNGLNYKLGGGEWLPSSEVTSGEVLVVQVSATLPVYESVLPTEAPADTQAPTWDRYEHEALPPGTTTPDETLEIDEPDGTG